MKQLVLRPIITEKSIGRVALRKYTFEVHPETNKIEVKKAIKDIYKVDAVKVNIINHKGKEKKYRGRISGKTKDWKMAAITLRKGQKIQEFEIKQDKK